MRKNRAWYGGLLVLGALLATPAAAHRWPEVAAHVGARSAAAYTGTAQERAGRHEDEDLPERDSFDQTYQLASGAPVKVSGINGAVTIDTADGPTAEVHIMRSARTRADLERHHIIVEQTAGGLVVRGENERGSGRAGGEVRQRVLLRLPRQIDLSVSGINGRTTVGALDGPIRLSGINGRVDVAQARGYSDISGINGGVTITIAQLGERGLRVSGVNGSVELRFADALNADLHVNGINGSVVTEVPNVTVQGRVNRSSFNAQVGTGGAPINVSGVNGRVRLAPRS